MCFFHLSAFLLCLLFFSGGASMSSGLSPPNHSVESSSTSGSLLPPLRLGSATSSSFGISFFPFRFDLELFLFERRVPSGRSLSESPRAMLSCIPRDLFADIFLASLFASYFCAF